MVSHCLQTNQVGFLKLHLPCLEGSNPWAAT